MSKDPDIQFINFTACGIGLIQATALLSVHEQERAARFVREKDARAYIITHAELRRLLAKRLGTAPSELEIQTDKYGKPYLIGIDSTLHFNISHSGDYALIAISDTGPVGVDIEQLNPKTDFMAIAERFFTNDEYLYIKRMHNDQMSAFYQVWTLKEAYVKAIGRGIGYGLDTFSVVSPAQQLVTQIENWHLQLLDAPAGYEAAVATES